MTCPWIRSRPLPVLERPRPAVALRGAGPAHDPGVDRDVEAEGEEAHARAPQTPGEGAIYVGPENEIIHLAHEVPAWVKVSPFIAMFQAVHKDLTIVPVTLPPPCSKWMTCSVST